MRRCGLLTFRGIRSSPFLGQICDRGRNALRAFTQSLSFTLVLPVVPFCSFHSKYKNLLYSRVSERHPKIATLLRNEARAQD
jgi:hypothetical protein